MIEITGIIILGAIAYFGWDFAGKQRQYIVQLEGEIYQLKRELEIEDDIVEFSDDDARRIEMNHWANEPTNDYLKRMGFGEFVKEQQQLEADAMIAKIREQREKFKKLS
ncbi:hypothetical protein [Methylobacter sp.]|uniref:hypothetical protein n=1 Tax=Methylobacter sp. TaxID=2051955 RepID=UPI003DA28913